MSNANQSGESRIAVVTGAARSIGFAIAKKLATDGITVLLCDQSHAGAESAAAELVAMGGTVIPLTVDIAKEESVAELFRAIDQRFGRLDILVNNAGVVPRVAGKIPTIADTPLDVWNLTIGVNLTGTFLVCRAAIPS